MSSQCIPMFHHVSVFHVCEIPNLKHSTDLGPKFSANPATPVICLLRPICPRENVPEPLPVTELTYGKDNGNCKCK